MPILQMEHALQVQNVYLRLRLGQKVRGFIVILPVMILNFCLGMVVVMDFVIGRTQRGLKEVTSTVKMIALTL